MAKKVIYQVERHKVLMVEVQNEQEEQAVLLANRDFEKMEKRAQRERLRTCSFDKLVEEDGFDVADDSPSVEETIIENIERRILAKRVHEAMEHLTSNQKQIITLIYFEGKTQKEVAEILHKEKSTISRNLEAAHKKIKKFFTKK